MKFLNREEQKEELKRIKSYRERIADLEEASKITLKAYENIHEAVDDMFYNISTQWEDGMDIEEIVGNLRKLMYEEE